MALNKNSEITKLIERYQISQEAIAYGGNAIAYQSENAAYRSLAKTKYSKIFQEAVERLKTRTLSISVGWYDTDEQENVGHQLIVNTSKGDRGVEKADDLGDNWYRMYLYDPNNPYFDNSENYKLISAYSKWDNRYLAFNKETGSWYMDIKVNSDGNNQSIGVSENKTYKEGQEKNGPHLHFVEFDYLPNNFDEKLPFYATNNGKKTNRIIVDGNKTNTFELKTKDGRTVFKVVDGKEIYSEYDYYLTSEKTSDEESAQKCIIYLEDSDYKFDLNNGSVSIVTDDKLMALKSDGSISGTFNTDANDFSYTANANVNVVSTIENVDDTDIYNSVRTEGILESGKGINLSYNDDTNKTNITSDSGNKFEVSTDSNNGSNIYENVDLSSWEYTYVNTSSWAAADVERAKAEGLFPEILENKDLTEPINRSEFAAVAVSVFEKLNGSEASYGDTPFADRDELPNPVDVAKAYALGITNGTDDNRFVPYDSITREDLTTMLCRALKKYKLDGWTLETDADYPLDTSGVSPYADDADISGYARESVYYMTKIGVVNGMGDNLFMPKSTSSAQNSLQYALATREQAVVMALRMVDSEN